MTDPGGSALRSGTVLRGNSPNFSHATGQHAAARIGRADLQRGATEVTGQIELVAHRFGRIPLGLTITLSCP